MHHTQISNHSTPTASLFRLPIASGVNVSISQGNNDTQHDHVGKQAWAFDFTVGQTNFVVTAAQGGQVIGANGDSTIQCSNVNMEVAPIQKYLANCWTYANYVLVADDDGTTAALYMHLLPNSLKVSSGMHVNQGDTLGLAGTTGWSTGVHLHFQIEDIPSSDQQQTQPPGWWWTQSRSVSFSNQEVLAQESTGVPQEGEHFVVSNSPVTILTPPTPTPVFSAGATWQGTFNYLSNGATFNGTLNMENLQDTTFNGSLSEPQYQNTVVNVNGSVSISIDTFSASDQAGLQAAIQMYGNGVGLIAFTDPNYRSGTDIALNCNYYAVVTASGTLQGVWYYPNSTQPDGTFTLQKTS